MKAMPTAASLIALIAVTLATTQSAQASHRDAEKASFALKVKTAEICREVRVHFHSCGQFRSLYKSAYEAYCLADKLHCAVHDGEDLHFAEKAAGKLEDLFDCMEDDIKKIKRSSPSRPSHFELHSHRHISSLHLKHLCKLIECAEDLADDLEDEIEDIIDDLHRRKPVGFERPLPPEAIPPRHVTTTIHRHRIGYGSRHRIVQRHYNVNIGRGFSMSFCFD